MSKKKIIITGTHITPAMELINQLKNDKKNNWEILYIGRAYNSSIGKQKSNESIVLPKKGVKFVGIRCGKYDRRYWPNTIAGIPDLMAGFVEAKKLVKNYRPDVIVSFGGYVSVPVMFAGFVRRVPLITHEQTPVSGLSTVINSWFAQKVALSFNNKAQLSRFGSKAVWTGNLVRKDIFLSDSKIFKNRFAGDKRKIIFVTGGNQGSEFINSVVIKLAKKEKELLWIHQTGRSQFEKFKDEVKMLDNYFPVDYVDSDDIGWIYQNSEMIISRGGANTASEIVALAKKAIMIPLPVSSGDEQRLNCAWVKEKQPEITRVIEQSDLNEGSLSKAIGLLLSRKTLLKKPSYSPNLKLLDLVYEVV